MVCPSSIPAGILTDTLRVLFTRPLPLAVGTGSSTTVPSPRQLGQVDIWAKLPRMVFCTVRTCPVPLQFGQGLRLVPALAPEPPQAGQFSLRWMVNCL